MGAYAPSFLPIQMKIDGGPPITTGCSRTKFEYSNLISSGFITCEKIVTDKHTDRPTEWHPDLESNRFIKGQVAKPSRKLSWKPQLSILKSLWFISHNVNVLIFTCYDFYRKSYVHKNHHSAKSFWYILINEVSQDSQINFMKSQQVSCFHHWWFRSYAPRTLGGGSIRPPPGMIRVKPLRAT